jgi:CENP-B N-terminal DNA-binding domain
MDKDELMKQIESEKSIANIAKHFGVCKSTIKYWFKKHGLRSKYSKNSFNGLICAGCSSGLKGKQKKFCNAGCKNKYFYTRSGSYESQRKRGEKRRRYYLNLLGGKCSACGYNKNIAAMSFHHKTPRHKKFPLTINKLSNRKESDILSEVDKCIILCANCHIEHHYPHFNNEV